MQPKIKLKIYTFLLIALIFSMYQETSAQKKKVKGKKPAVVEVKPVPPEIAYTVSMSKPWTHLLEVEARIKWQQMPDQAEVMMPVWTPGSYLVREYARHVQDFAAKGGDGNPLTWQKTNKNTWQIGSKGQKEIAVSYRVYANELTVRTNELNSDHAFWNNGALLMYPKGQLGTGSTVTVNPYGDWKVATGLPKVDSQPNTFKAENFDVLYDSPFEVSNFKEIAFDVQGVPHRYVITGEGNYDPAKLARDTRKIVEETVKIFGDIPYKDYTFILNLRGGGGLEHLNSTALQSNRFAFKPESRYQDFMSLVAHEYFHAWNVKRIKPDALGPFDYTGENYTKLLWVAEGGTEYYAGVLLQRAGLMTDKEFLTGKATGFQALQNRPGRFQTSLEEASFDAWIKYYRQDENAVNNQISYYDKGEIVNFLLDLEIRRASAGTKSMDYVMRHLYNEYSKKGKNFTSQDFQKACELVAGKSLDDFFGKYVRGRDDIDYDSILSAVGLKLSTGAGGREQANIGAETAQDGDRLTIRAIPAGSPAYEQGLNTGDQIVAIDGYRANQTFLQNYIADKHPGDKIKLSIFRFDKLSEVEITLGGRVPQNYRISTVETPTDAQKAAYKSYFGTDLK